MKSRLNKSLTLLELLIALGLFSVIVLAFTSIQYFSHFHLVTSERESLLQNEISFALEHMGKNVQQGVGNPARSALARLAGNNGFRVFIEPNPATPANPGDDLPVDYILQANTLTYRINGVITETFSPHILPGVVYGFLPANPASGFYINITNPGPSNGSIIEVALVARWQPANPVRLDNPQVVMKTRLYARGSATN